MSRLSVSLPYAHPIALSETESTPPRVLLVNDTPDLRRLKRFVLERAGYVVMEAVDGPATIGILRTSAIPLVAVMNTRVPLLDATDILRLVSAEPKLQTHAYVLTTALAGLLPDDLLRLTQQLCVPILGKPFTEHELLSAVESQLLRL